MIAALSTSPIISMIVVNCPVASPTARNDMPVSKSREPMILCSDRSMSCLLPLILLYNAVTII